MWEEQITFQLQVESEGNSNSPPTVAVVKHSSTEKAQPVWKTDNFLKGYFR